MCLLYVRWNLLFFGRVCMPSLDVCTCLLWTCVHAFFRRVCMPSYWSACWSTNWSKIYWAKFEVVWLGPSVDPEWRWSFVFCLCLKVVVCCSACGDVYIVPELIITLFTRSARYRGNNFDMMKCLLKCRELRMRFEILTIL